MAKKPSQNPSSSSSCPRCETLGDHADHRWRSKWTAAPNLVVSFPWKDAPFMDSVLTIYTSPKRKKFCINIDLLDYCTPKLSLWLRFAVDRRVEDLSVNAAKGLHEMASHFSVPLLLYGCSPSVNLHLRLCSIPFSRSVAWSNLRSLSICGSEIINKVMHDILKGTLKYLRSEECRSLKQNVMLCSRSFEGKLWFIAASGMHLMRVSH